MKIITSIMAADEAILLQEAETYKKLDFDILEWRADYFIDLSNIQSAGARLRQIIKQPILFTFRTKNEGGMQPMSTFDYMLMNKHMIDSGNVNMVDIELFTGVNDVKSMTEYAHSNGVEVVISNHDFEKTPPKDEIVIRLQKMHSLGADIAKIAVMPQTIEDVLTLLSATAELTKQTEQRIIAISMSKLGVLSRIASDFGSWATFGAAHVASAPGQIAIDKLRMILNL